MSSLELITKKISVTLTNGDDEFQVYNWEWRQTILNDVFLQLLGFEKLSHAFKESEPFFVPFSLRSREGP